MKFQNTTMLIFMVALVLLSTKVFAVTVTIPDVEGNKCETIIVPINIDDKTDIVSIDFIVDYDPDVLTATEARTTNITDDWLIEYKVTSGRIKITIISATEPTGTGAVVEIDFNVVISANVGDTSPLTLTQALINEGLIDSTLISGTFTVVNAPPEVIDLTVAISEVFRTQSVTVSSNVQDCEDDEGILTSEMQYRAPSGDWEDLEPEFVDDHWQAIFTPDKTAELGTYDFRVRYTDTHAGDSGWHEELDILTVKNNLPTAQIADPEPGTACKPVTLQGVGSDTETEDAALTLEWDLDDDGEYDDGTGPTVTWTYDDYGEHPVSLRVTDADSDFATANVQITINLSPGDVSGNCSVTGYDGAMVLQYLVALIDLDEYQQAAGDVNQSGALSPMDASLIIQYVVGIIDELPVEAAPVMNITPRSYHLTISFPIAKSGGNITVPVIVNDTTELLSGQMTLTYDASILTPIKVSKTALTKDFLLAHNIVDNRLNIAFAGAKIDSDKGAIFKLEFQVSPTAQGGRLRPIIASQVLLNGYSAVAVQSSALEILPAHTRVLQNYPNPFNPETWIPFELAKPAEVTIRIYNTKGQLIRTINLGQKEAGFYMSKERAAHWDGHNQRGEPTSSGLYFYTIQAGNFTATRKMILMK